MPGRLVNACRVAITFDGAVKQRCLHRTTTLSEPNNLLQAYDMKRNLVELNYAAAQWKHKAVWNKWYMEVKRGHQMIQLWNDHETEITKKTSNSYEVKTDDIHRTASAAKETFGPSTRQHVPSNIRHGRCLYCTSSDRRIVTKGSRRMGEMHLRKQSPSCTCIKPKKADQSSSRKMVEKCQCQSSWTDHLMMPRH